MCILTQIYKRNSKKKGVSLVELITCIILMGVIAGFAIISFRHAVEKQEADNAIAILKSLWKAEENYFSWRGRYTDNWNELEIDNPNLKNGSYTYTIVFAGDRHFTISAFNNNTRKGFIIDQSGNITKF